MWQRWRSIILMVAGFFAITVVARLISLLFANDNERLQTRIGYVAFGAVALLAGGLAGYWGLRYPVSQVVLDVGGAVVIGCLLSVLVGPFISGDLPFEAGAGNFFGQIWVYLGVGFGGGLLAMLGLTAVGKDYRSQALKRFTESQRLRPPRAVRR